MKGYEQHYGYRGKRFYTMQESREIRENTPRSLLEMDDEEVRKKLKIIDHNFLRDAMKRRSEQIHNGEVVLNSIGEGYVPRKK